ncbi:MAG: glycerol kinase GlpK [Bdellovibrionales bacterium]|nr:glycerol kinase GlpK [Bdellovibrionales bacterium]
MADYILAIDQGTTGTTALLIDAGLTVVGKANVEFPQHFPKPGWVEHDLNEIWNSVCKAVGMVLQHAKVNPAAIRAIGITNQRETTCLWHRDSEATPVGKAIVWQDRRTAPDCVRLKKRKGVEKSVKQKTGLLLDPYFSGTKLAWMLQHYTKARTLAQSGKIAFGTIESFLVYKMSGRHVTEPTNASRTMLMNLTTCQWDSDLLKLFKIPKTILPDIYPSAVEYGKTKGMAFLPDGIPIAGLVGDQQAALFGQACFKPGMAKATYGTGAFVLANIGAKPIYSKHKLLTSVAWKIGEKPTYCIEGSAFIAGAAVQWLRDQLQIIKRSGDVEALAREVGSSEGVLFVPALSGMGAPHWLPSATGLITGMTRGTTRAHIARATLEGVAFQIRELLEAMGKDLKKRIKPLKVDGGASLNDLLMQFQSDLLGVDVVRAQVAETTALGSALMAGLAIGMWSGLGEIEKKWKSDKRFAPKMDGATRKVRIQQWDRAMQAVKLLSES